MGAGMLAVGDTAPDIDADTSSGTRFRLSWGPGEPHSLCTVLFFYPKAFTSGCTLETRLFKRGVDGERFKMTTSESIREMES